MSETAQLYSNLKQVPFPLTNLAVVYIITGSDYISSFFHTSEKAFSSKYVLETVFHACSSNLPPISACEYGWRMVNNRIQIVWDEEEVMDKVKANKGCGCKSAKCDGSTAGCRNCYQMCRPCTMKCKCKLKYNNLHNNGGTCPCCAPARQSDDGDNSDMKNDELLPVVETQRETINTDSETDGDDEHEQ